MNEDTAKVVLAPGLESMLDDYLQGSTKEEALKKLRVDIERWQRRVALAELLERYLTGATL